MYEFLVKIKDNPEIEQIFIDYIVQNGDINDPILKLQIPTGKNRNINVLIFTANFVIGEALADICYCWLLTGNNEQYLIEIKNN